MSIRVYDPTEAARPYEGMGIAQRPAGLQGLKVGLLENRKRNSAAILERLGRQLQARYGVASCTMRSISTGTLLSPQIVDEVGSSCDVAVIGVGD